MKLTLPCRSFSIHASRSNKSQCRSIDDDHEKRERISIKCNASKTYSLVQVDGELAGDNVGDGRSRLLAGGLDVGHFCRMLASQTTKNNKLGICY